MSTVTQKTSILKDIQTKDTPKIPATPPETPDTPGSGSIPGAVKDQHSNFSLSIWLYLIEEIGLEGEIKQTEIADAVGCSRRTVIKVLNGFRRCNLIEWESFNGQGRGIRLKNLWLERGKKIANKINWARGFEAEGEYLKSRWTRQGQLGVNRVEGLRYIEQTNTKEHNLRRASYINNPNLTESERRKRWLDKQHGLLKTSLKTGHQKVLEWDLRTYLEKQGLDSKAIKAICDTYWQNVKDKTLNTARKVLKELKSKALHLFDEVTETVADYYRIANRFIYFDLLNDTSGQSKRSGNSTPESYDEDKAKAEKTRQNGFSEIIDEIFDGDNFSLGNESKPKKKSSDLLQKIRDIYENYGEKGLRSWCKGHHISYQAAKKKLEV